MHAAQRTQFLYATGRNWHSGPDLDTCGVTFRANRRVNVQVYAIGLLSGVVGSTLGILLASILS